MCDFWNYLVNESILPSQSEMLYRNVSKLWCVHVIIGVSFKFERS